MKYVVECHKKVERERVGLGSPGWCKPGQYITSEGEATNKIEEAAIYDDLDPDFKQFPFEEPMGDGTDLRDFLRKTSVEVKRTISKAR